MGFLKSVANFVAAPIVAPAKAVAAVVSGEDPVKAAISGIAPAIPGVSSAGLIQDVTGGSAAQSVANIPLAGGVASNYLTAGQNLAAGKGTLQDALDFAKANAAVAGTGAAIAGVGALGTGLGAKILAGDPSVLNSLVEEYTGVDPSTLASLYPKNQKGSTIPVSDFFEGDAGVPGIAKPKSKISTVGYLAIGGVVLGAYYFSRVK